MSSVQFLGFEVSAKGIVPARDRTRALREMDVETLLRDPDALQYWIGVLQYYNRHIPRCAILLGPLQARLQARCAGPIDPACYEAHRELVRAMTEEGMVVIRPDFGKPFYVICDAASTVGGAAVLAQLDDEGFERPVAYFCRRWSGTSEPNWAPVEHECATVHDAIKHFAELGYLGGAPFTVITDSEPLVWLKKVRQPKGRLAGWTMNLQAFDFEVVHRKGINITNLDGLSRLAQIMQPSKGEYTPIGPSPQATEATATRKAEATPARKEDAEVSVPRGERVDEVNSIESAEGHVLNWDLSPRRRDEAATQMRSHPGESGMPSSTEPEFKEDTHEQCEEGLLSMYAGVTGFRSVAWGGGGSVNAPAMPGVETTTAMGLEGRQQARSQS